MLFRSLTRWLFPKQLLTIVGDHHDPTQCTNYGLYTTIIQISDLLSALVVDEEMLTAALYPQFTTLLPHAKTLWLKYNLVIDEEQLQKWKKALLTSIEKDSAILNIFTS